MKSSGYIEYNTMDIYKTIQNIRYRSDYDKVYESGDNFAKIADQTYLVYQKSKKISIVKSRDFVMILHFNITPTGIIHIIGMSIDREDLYPLNKDTVRGWIPVILFYVYFL